MPTSDLTCKFIAVLLSVALVTSDPIDLGEFEEQDELHVRNKRQAVEERPGCLPGAKVPPTRVDTTSRLASLRGLFSTVSGGDIHAYIVPSEDAHYSEYVAAYDQRRGYISGFQGSAGTAVVMSTKAALWTDSRYFLEAEDTLDCNWILMRERIPGTPSITEWLKEELKSTTNPRVGASPFLMTARRWKSYKEIFDKAGIQMVSIAQDMVDQIWTTGRPLQPNTPINELPMEYAGRSWQDKVSDVRALFEKKEASAYIVTSLDETAWLFNLRASDISYNPFFISYAIVDIDRVRLYILNHNTKLTQNPTDSASKKKVYEHLNTGSDGSCDDKTDMCVEVIAYDPAAITAAVTAITSADAANKVWVSLDCNQAIYSAIPENQLIHDKSAIALMKSKKNEVERRGMKASHNRDSAALITFLEKLEREVQAGKYWTEVSASLDLKQHRLARELNRGLSFATIAGSGSNGAIIHYRPTNATDKQITTSEMFLLDSGGQYLDGTTDVTRTFHFGTPSDYEKECYTRVLMGHVDLAQMKWPKGLYGKQIDAVSRAPLWKAGLRYLHGTGHGIGAYLSVHEGPASISVRSYVNPKNEPLSEYMYFSDEPGYYEDGKFGVRLETIVTVVPADTKYSFKSFKFLEFEPITLVPYEPHLIDFGMLHAEQKQWLVDYHTQVEREVGPLLNAQALQWVKRRTDEFKSQMRAHPSGTQPTCSSHILLTLITCVITFIFKF